MHIEINPAYSVFEPFIQSLPKNFRTQGIVLYKVRNEVRLIEVNGVKLVVKKFKVPHFINRIAYTYFRKSKARRSYEYSLELIANGFGAAQPVAYVEDQSSSLLSDSFYISLFCEYEHDFNEFRESEMGGREEILKDFARFTARMHEVGIRHLDYGGGNILFRPSVEGTKFCLIDVNRLEKGDVGIEEGCENFKLLYMKEEAFTFLISEYAKIRNLDSSKCLQLIKPYIH